MNLIETPQFNGISNCFCFHGGLAAATGKHVFLEQQQEQQQSINTTSDFGTATLKKQRDEVDALLSDAMNELTFVERQEQQEALHGVTDEITDESSLIDDALQELDAHLQRKKSGSVYEIAERMNPAYVNARSFRIMFLRGNRYDTKASADQMIKFFEMKQQLFGVEKLVKDITIHDLDEDDIASLRHGSMQQAGKDRSGRPIFLQVPGLRSFKTIQNELRSRFYITMNLLKSEEIQLKGCVLIVYAIGAYRDKREGGGYVENTKLSLALPMHTAAFHHCCDETSEYLMGNVVLRVMPAKLRARFRIHFGSHWEALYRLSTYGILPGLLPLTSFSDNLNMTYHTRWVDMRLKQEEEEDDDDPRDSPVPDLIPATQSSSVSPLLQPNLNDILYVGGKKNQNLGNQRLRARVKELAQVYDGATNEKKRIVVDGMIGEVQNLGGRFLKKAKGPHAVWEELSLHESRRKLTQAFRNHRRRLGGEPTQ